MKIINILLTCSFLASHSFSQIPTEDLILHLPFNGTTNDESGNDLDGTAFGASLTLDRFSLPNSAFDFDGVDDIITLPASDLLNVEFPFSISLWYYRDVAPEGIQMLFKTDADDETYSGFWINMATTGHIVAAYGDGLGFGEGHRISKKSTEALSLGEWHHITAVFNALEDIDLYIDCILDPGSYSGSGSTMTYLGFSTTIGRYDWRIFDGKIDDIRVYSDGLSAEEIDAICKETASSNNIKKVNFSDFVSVYPNPTTDKVFIEIDKDFLDKNNYDIQMTDLLGRTITTTKLTSSFFEIDLNELNLASGSYFITISNSSEVVNYHTAKIQYLR